jgi:hypothetical protein
MRACNLLLLAALLAGIVCSALVPITTEAAMRDANGAAIYDCLEPHIYFFAGAHYAYGFTVRSPASHAMKGPNFTVSVYVSADFASWMRVSTLPMVSALMPPYTFLYNERSGLYVGFGEVYGASIAVFTSLSPAGPFAFSHFFATTPHGNPGDMIIFGEGASAWLVYNSFDGPIPQRFTYTYQLTPDFFDIVPQTMVNTSSVMEGLWVVHAFDTYFLLGSGLVGFNVDDDFYLTAPSMAGPWTRRGYLAPVGTKTFQSQVFQGLTVTGSNGTTHVYFGHRWKGQGPDYSFPNATSIWLPIQFNPNGTITEMTYVDSWTLDT